MLKPESEWHKSSADDFQQELKRFLKGKLSGFAIPGAVSLVKELEKTSTGKGLPSLQRHTVLCSPLIVSKKTLRDMLKSKFQA